jgi:hypothetical protein
VDLKVVSDDRGLAPIDLHSNPQLGNLLRLNFVIWLVQVHPNCHSRQSLRRLGRCDIMQTKPLRRDQCAKPSKISKMPLLSL